jgi:hypothetical protein
LDQFSRVHRHVICFSFFLGLDFRVPDFLQLQSFFDFGVSVSNPNKK